MEVVGATSQVVEHGVIVRVGRFELLLPAFWHSFRVESFDNAAFSSGIIGPGITFTFSMFDDKLDVATLVDGEGFPPGTVTETEKLALVIRNLHIEGRRLTFGDFWYERYAAVVGDWTINFGFHTNAEARTSISPDSVRQMTSNVVLIALLKAGLA